MNPAVVAYLACAFIWGSTWFAIRVCIAPGGYPTYAAAALRFTLAAAILIALVLAGIARPGPKTRRAWLWTSTAGLLNAIGYGLIYTAETRITGGLSAVLYGTLPIMTAVIASATGTEKPTTGSVVGSLVSLGGIAGIYADRLGVSSAQAAGVLMVLASVLLSTIYNVILKREAHDQHPLAVNAVFLSVTAIALWAFTLIAERRAIPPPALKPTLALLYLGIVGSVIAFASYFYLLKHVSLMTVSTLVFLQPLVALTADALWDPDARSITRWAWAGIGATLVGIVITVMSRARRA